LSRLRIGLFSLAKEPYDSTFIRHFQVTAIEWQGQRGVILIYPPALFGECEIWKNSKFLLPLTSKNTAIKKQVLMAIILVLISF
jgi:hypothetical protein